MLNDTFSVIFNHRIWIFTPKFFITLLAGPHVPLVVISQNISVRTEGMRSGMKFRTTISLQWLIGGSLEKELSAWFKRIRQRKTIKRRNIFFGTKYGTELKDTAKKSCAACLRPRDHVCLSKLCKLFTDSKKYLYFATSRQTYHYRVINIVVVIIISC